MVEHILFKTLERHGMHTIPTEGEAIPGLHEVTGEVEGDEKDVGIIASVLKMGFTLRGKVLRPAKVCISKF
jgi:molecular chaperone GrpE